MEPNNSSPDVLDALRIQAAAVAAQQAALTEEEFRLQQRRSALEKQEAQLAAHLDDRRRRLLELQDEIKTERAAIEQERTVLLRELRQEKENAERERQRFVDLRNRQKQRWQAHWRQQEATLKRREHELDAEKVPIRRVQFARVEPRGRHDVAILDRDSILPISPCMEVGRIVGRAALPYERMSAGRLIFPSGAWQSGYQQRGIQRGSTQANEKKCEAKTTHPRQRFIASLSFQLHI